MEGLNVNKTHTQVNLELIKSNYPYFHLMTKSHVKGFFSVPETFLKLLRRQKERYLYSPTAIQLVCTACPSFFKSPETLTSHIPN